jgi:RNA polymerase sigma-70 factor (ECF subfamily)
MESYKITDDKDFSKIYQNFPKMVRFAQEYVVSKEESENIVQDLFLYLWETRETLGSISNMNAFLFTLLKNRCIDFYRRYNRFEGRNQSLSHIQEEELHLKMESLREFDVNMFTVNEIEEVIDKAVNNLPEKCQKIFVLSRMEGLKHEEIAEQLNISVNTVQNHIATALRKLKIELKDYLPLFIFII